MRLEHWFYMVPLRLRSLLLRKRVEQELDEEFRYHLDRQIEENVARGMSAEAARYAALRALGGIEQHKEACRDTRRTRLLEDLVRDARYGLRMMRRSPGFTLVAVLTLALGIGVNTAFFSVINAVLLRPLPYEDPTRLVSLTQFAPAINTALMPTPTYLAWRDSQRVFESVTAYADHFCDANLTGLGEPERVNRCAGVTASFFSVLGVQPAVGRAFLPEEDQPGGPHVLILSDAFWRTHFGADPQIVGKTLTLGSADYVVVGIMPAQFQHPGGMNPTVFVPLALPSTADWQRGALRNLEVVARLKPGIQVEQARANLASINRSLEKTYPALLATQLAGAEPSVVSLRDKLVGNTRTVLLVLLAAVAFVLLIACVNVTNLLLARASSRRKEIALRAALGASRWRIARQLLTEALLLAGFGALGGIALAVGMIHLLQSIGSNSIRQLQQLPLDTPVLVFTLTLTLVTGVLCSLAPALLCTGTELHEAAKENSGRTGTGRGGQRVRSVLVVVELALSLVLLIGAGLLLRSFARLLAVEPGFDPGNVLSLQVTLTETHYPQPGQRRLFFQTLLNKLEALPGVKAAGATTALPLHYGFSRREEIVIEGQVNSWPSVPVAAISPDYFRAMRIPLCAGRSFSAADQESARPVVVVSREFERRFLRGESAIGRVIRFEKDGAQTRPDYLVVGVAGDVRHFGRDEEAPPVVYLSFLQFPRAAMTLAIRTDAPVAGLLDATKREVQAIDPSQPIYDVATVEQRLSDSLRARRFDTALLLAFAVLAFCLAGVGLYGVMSYWVTQRTHEIGVRLALGAQRRSVIGLVMREAATLTCKGLGAGLCGALLLTRSLQTMLYRTSPTDLLTFLFVVGALLGGALLATWIPAIRAARVEPIIALRHE